MAFIGFGFSMVALGAFLAFEATSLKRFSASKDAPILTLFAVLFFVTGVLLIGNEIGRI